VYEGAAVSINYDPLVSKLVAYGADREEALARMRRAVAEYTVLGIKTTLPFFARVLRHPVFVSGDYDTSFIEGAFRQAGEADERPWEVAVVAAALQAHRERQETVHAADSGPAGGSAWRGAGWRTGDRFP
jgi:acetyl-CoA carboxylase, biotin carboxylase subunit